MRSLVEPAMREALSLVVTRGNPMERSLAQMCLDLLDVTGDHPGVIDLLNRRALAELEKQDAA